jgi:NADPH:quinone reductase-like Zn-dependent oxidoreductase
MDRACTGRRQIGRITANRPHKPPKGRKPPIPKTPDYFHGKTIVITGAGGGIGRAAALVFAREGANVVVTDIDAEAARRTAETIRQGGQDAIAIAADVTSREAINAAIDQAIARFGRVNFLYQGRTDPLCAPGPLCPWR